MREPIQRTVDAISAIMTEGCEDHEIDKRQMERLAEKIYNKYFKNKRPACELAFLVGCLIEELGFQWQFITEEVLKEIENERKAKVN